MKSTFKVLFYLKKDKISKDGKVPVMGRITVNGTQAGFSCKLNIDPALWDEKTNYLKSQRNTLSREIHQMLENIKAEKKALIVMAEKDENTVRSAANIPGVRTALVTTMNVYDIINHTNFIVTKEAVKKIEEVYS